MTRIPRPDKHRVSPPATREDEAVFDLRFWLTYMANTSAMIGISILFRYADFIEVLGGTEFQLGWIVGIGMVGSLLMRLAQGVGIDVYGARRIWLISIALFSFSCIAHLAITRVDGPTVYVLRILYNTSIAGLFGASITYISRRASIARMAEVVGILGTSGFVGMVAGTYIGDVLCAARTVERPYVDQLFLASALFGAIAFAFAFLATRGEAVPAKRRQLPFWHTLRHYHPGPLLVIGVAMGVGIGMPAAFLRPFAADLGIAKIGLFFTVYCCVAFAVRMLTRRLPERIGIRKMVILGMSCLVASMFLYLTVSSYWQLAIPAVAVGFAHAFLFPSVVAGGSASFPERYRGLGTTLMLATYDLGNLVGGPTIGGILRLARSTELPRYHVTFVSVGLILATMTVFYAVATWGQRPMPPTRKKRRKAVAEETRPEPTDVEAACSA